MVAARAHTDIAGDEVRLLAALRRGDEDAFRLLVRKHSGAMTRVALAFVPTRAIADEVVQDAWLNVLEGLDRFEGRSSLRTWILVIVGNCARRRGAQEGRSSPLSELVRVETAGDDLGVDSDRFFSPDHPRWAGMWASSVRLWDSVPEERLLSGELRTRIRETIDGLPRIQRAVITLRDLEGWTAEEVCVMLEISDGNQRVLLHRARTTVRGAVERYVDGHG